MNITEKEVEAFLKHDLSKQVNDVVMLSGGKHSEAFSYISDEKSYVIRFNETDFGFKKDKYANQNYPSTLLIPEILDIGSYKKIYFCISRKVEGHTIRSEYNQKDFSSLEKQFDIIEQISKIEIPENAHGYGEWSPDTLNGEYGSLLESILVYFEPNLFFEWDTLEKTESFDKSFVEYIKENILKLLPYSENIRELRHGDFGNENVLIKDGKISGVLDWHKASYDDHLFDVGRVVLYCPDRHITSNAALKYYADCKHQNYKERILLGVYLTMLTNYGYASRARNVSSLNSSPNRIKDIEKYFNNSEKVL